LRNELDTVTLETPLFWSTWGRRTRGKTRAPMPGQKLKRAVAFYEEKGEEMLTKK
jgi:hypothetical protein